MDLKYIELDSFLDHWEWDEKGIPKAIASGCKGCNIVVQNENYDDSLLTLFAGQEVNFVPPTTDMWDLLVWIGAFESKGQARKNWTKTDKLIPAGWNEFLVGKHKANKIGLFILNPVKGSESDRENLE